MIATITSSLVAVTASLLALNTPAVADDAVTYLPGTAEHVVGPVISFQAHWENHGTYRLIANCITHSFVMPDTPNPIIYDSPEGSIAEYTIIIACGDIPWI